MSLAVLCPGQGFQETATIVSLKDEPDVRPVVEAFENATEIPVEVIGSISASDLRSNAIAQPLVCATGLAAYNVLQNRLPEVRVFARYSVGELTAYGCAGWFSAEEMVRLAAERARAMDAVSEGPAAMAAVRGLTRTDLDGLLNGRNVHVAIVNAADRFVISGTAAEMAGVLDRVQARGGGSTRLDVSVASHTLLLKEAVGRFRAVLEGSRMCPGIPVLAGIDGTPVLGRTRVVETLSRQLSEPVLW